MNHDETARICRLIASIAPSQAFDETTPATWQPILAGVRLVDAIEAVKRLGGRMRYIAPVDILDTVREIRSERLAGIERMLPDADPDDVPGYLAALRAQIAAGADGRDVPHRPALDAGHDDAPGVAKAVAALAAIKDLREHAAAREQAAAEALEAERARQMDALAPLVAEEAAP